MDQQDTAAFERWLQDLIDEVYAIATLLEFGGESVHPGVRQYDELRLRAAVTQLEQLLDRVVHGTASS